MKKPIVFVTWLAGLGVPMALAQTYVPASISQLPGGTNGQVKVTWPTTPGRTYEPLTTPGLNQAWGTNIAPIQARSTVGQLVQDMDQQSLFYRIRERPVSLGSTGGVTTAMIASVERIAGLAFTTAQRNQMLSVLNGTDFMSPGAYSTMRQWRLLNSDPPALVFNPLPLGFVPETNQNPIVWSTPGHATAPTNRAELAYYSVRDLGVLLHSGQITSTELTQLCLDRLKRYDSNLFCVVTLTEELALRQAAQADAELAQGHYRGPLHGIPCGIKDLFATRGYRTTWGAAPYSDQVLDQDAEVVRRLNAAGAVLVAKLSLGSLAMGDVWFGGTTRNPWNLSAGSSGSSAGPAAATAAGLVPFAIGTETFGSIVSPCSVCRVTGLRPTFGRVSRTGAMSLSWSMDKVGPICRSVEDCAIVFDAIRGSDGVDRGTLDAPFNYDPNRNLETIRIGYRGAYVLSTNLSRLAAIFGSDRLVEIKLPSYPYYPMLTIFLVEAAAGFDELTRYGGDAFLTSQAAYDWPNLLRIARTVPAVEYLQADRLRQKLIQDMAALMSRVDVFVTSDLDDDTLAATNFTGQPCAVVPNGDGTGLCFIGKLLDEATVLRVAKAYQDATSFHTNHPPLFPP